MSALLTTTLPPPKRLTGPQRLWAAVLANAVMGLEQRLSIDGRRNRSPQNRKLRDESLTWIRSHLVTPGSFIFVCDTLRIDPEFLRERLLRKYTMVPWTGEPDDSADTALVSHDEQCAGLALDETVGSRHSAMTPLRQSPM